VELALVSVRTRPRWVRIGSRKPTCSRTGEKSEKMVEGNRSVSGSVADQLHDVDLRPHEVDSRALFEEEKRSGSSWSSSLLFFSSEPTRLPWPRVPTRPSSQSGETGSFPRD
jgi:hypothetical protein